MAIEFKLPELGENITSGDVTRIMVKVGDTVAADQPVLEMETGKATVEIPTDVGGVVTQIHVKEGSKAKVGQVILSLDPAGAAPAKTAKPAAAKATAAPPPPAAPPKPAPTPEKPRPAAPPPPASPSAPAPTASRDAVAASPSTRQFAREVGVDVTQVQGTGTGGRISVSDVKAHARNLIAQAGTAVARPAAPPFPDLSKWGPVERQPLSAMRQATAQHMAVCWNTIPHVTLHDKADITEIEKLRQDNKKKAESAGGKLTLTAFLIKILASALKTHPKFNAALDLDRNELVFRQYAHIGIAMDTEKGLIVPVIRDADKKNVFQIAAELTELGARAKAGKVALADMQGGSISLTNLGAIGCGYFTPIVNYPEVAILGVGKAQTEPVLTNGFFQPRLMAPLSLSFDHRVVDGADGARFLQWIIAAIQQPALLSLEG